MVTMYMYGYLASILLAFNTKLDSRPTSQPCFIPCSEDGYHSPFMSDARNQIPLIWPTASSISASCSGLSSSFHPRRILSRFMSIGSKLSPLSCPTCAGLLDDLKFGTGPSYFKTRRRAWQIVCCCTVDGTLSLMVESIMRRLSGNGLR